MLYISYDDVRTLDDRARLGIYEHVLNQVKEAKFNVFMIDLTEEQLEIVKKQDKCPIYFDIKADTGFNYALSLAVIGFIQEPNALSQAGLTNTWGMSFDEIDSRLMCSSYIDHINTYRNDNKLGDVTADLLIARYLDMLELEIKALNNKI